MTSKIECQHSHKRMYPNQECPLCMWEKWKIKESDFVIDENPDGTWMIGFGLDVTSDDVAHSIKETMLNNQRYAKYYLDFENCDCGMVTQEQLQVVGRVTSQIYQIFYNWWHLPSEDQYSETISKLLIRELYLAETGKDILDKLTVSMEELSRMILPIDTCFMSLWNREPKDIKTQ